MQPLVEAHEREEAAHTGLDTHPSGKPGTLASVDAMMIAAKERWASRGMPGEVGFLFVNHVGNSNAYVSIYRDSTDRVATVEGLHFEGSTGRVLFEDPPAGPHRNGQRIPDRHAPAAVQALDAALADLRRRTAELRVHRHGLHLLRREAQARRMPAEGFGGSRWVDALAVTTVTGMVVATAVRCS